MADLEPTQAELKLVFDALPVIQRDALQAAAARVRSHHAAFAALAITHHERPLVKALIFDPQA